MFNKKAKMEMGWVGIAVVLVIGYLLINSGKEAQAPTTPYIPPTTTTGCALAPSLTPLAADKYAPGSALTTVSFLYRVNGGPITQGTSGTGITTGLAVGDNIEYVFNNTAYSDVHGTSTIACGSNRIDGNVMDALDANADVDVQFYNTNNGNLNSASDNQSLTNNDVKDLTLKIIPASKKGGKDCIMSLNYNVSTYDQVKVGDFARVNTPTYVTPVNTASQVISYALGNLENSQEVATKLHIDVKNVDPVAGTTSTITYYINCADWYVNTDTGAFAFGLENQNGAEIVDGTASIITGSLYMS